MVPNSVIEALNVQPKDIAGAKVRQPTGEEVAAALEVETRLQGFLSDLRSTGDVSESDLLANQDFPNCMDRLMLFTLVPAVVSVARQLWFMRHMVGDMAPMPSCDRRGNH